MSVTIGDVILEKTQAEQLELRAKAAVAAAEQAHRDAQAETVAANRRLKESLGRIGPTFRSNEDGTIEVWIPDATEDGFHAIRPVPIATPLAPRPDVNA